MLLRCSNLDASLNHFAGNLEARAAVNEQNKQNSISYAASINVMMRLCVNRDSTGNNIIYHCILTNEPYSLTFD